MRNRLFLFPAVLGLVAFPMFIGFAGTDAASGRWDRVSRHSASLVRDVLSMRAASAKDDDPPYEAYREALSVLKSDYYGDKIDTKKSKDLTYEAIRGMLGSLNDPFTSFLDPDEWTSMQQTTRGDFEGIGAMLEQFGPESALGVRVVRPIPDSPAYRAGLKAKDVIVSVGVYNEEGVKVKTVPTLGKNINDVVRLIKGPKGTKVDIEVTRAGHPGTITFHLVRAHIEPPIVQSWMEDPQNKIGHILLNEFNEKSEQQFDAAYKRLQAEGMRALIFDLRYNPGGLLNVAVEMGSHFVDHGPIVWIQEKNGQQQPLRARRTAISVDIPVAVLINENSASASEIVSGAIKDNQAGYLIGEHTFGKGLVQTLFPLADGSALRLTTAKYFTPLKKDINNKYDEDHRPIPNTGGIKPDLEVKEPEDFVDQDWSPENKKHDLQLQKALDYLRTRIARNTASKPR